MLSVVSDQIRLSTVMAEHSDSVAMRDRSAITHGGSVYLKLPVMTNKWN